MKESREGRSEESQWRFVRRRTAVDSLPRYSRGWIIVSRRDFISSEAVSALKPTLPKNEGAPRETMRAVVVAIILLVATPSFAQTDAFAEWARNPAMPSAGLLWGSKIEIEDQACCGAGRHGTPAADNNDASVLATFPDRAVRDGLVLKLRLDGGRSLKITDCVDDACEVQKTRRHRLVAWWPRSRYYIVDVGLYEGKMAYLIRETDGLVLRVPAPPILSPDGRYAVASDPSVMTGGDLQFLDMRVDPPAFLPFGEGGATCANPPDLITLGGQVKWIDDTRVLFSHVDLMDGKTGSEEMQIVGGKVVAGCVKTAR